MGEFMGFLLLDTHCIIRYVLGSSHLLLLYPTSYCTCVRTHEHVVAAPASISKPMEFTTIDFFVRF